MRVINFSEARGSLKGVIDQVIADADYTIIARRDAPDAVVMSLDTFNGLMETVHLLKSPANAAHLARSIEQYRKGEVMPPPARWSIGCTWPMSASSKLQRWTDYSCSCGIQGPQVGPFPCPRWILQYLYLQITCDW